MIFRISSISVTCPYAHLTARTQSLKIMDIFQTSGSRSLSVNAMLIFSGKTNTAIYGLGVDDTAIPLTWWDQSNLSSLNLSLSSSSTTSRELRQQFAACSGWRWFEVGKQFKKNCHVLVNQFYVNFHYKTLSCRKMKYVYRDVKWCFNALIFSIWNHHKCLNQLITLHLKPMLWV